MQELIFASGIYRLMVKSISFKKVLKRSKTLFSKTEFSSWVLFVFLGVLSAGILVSVLGDGKLATQVAPPTILGGASLTPDSLGNQRTLIVLVNFLNDRREPNTIADAQAALADSDRVLRELSYGKTWATGTAIGWITLPLNASCMNDEITRATLDAVDPQVDFRQYDRLAIVIPAQPVGTPGFCITHTVFGKGAYLTNDGPDVRLGRMMFYGAVSAPPAGSLMAEYLHTLGLDHENGWRCSPNILGSTCDLGPGGQGDEHSGEVGRHFNAFQKEKLGWFNPGDIITVPTADGTYTYTLKPYESASSASKVLKVPGYDPYRGQAIWYYLEWRQPIGLDAEYFTLHPGTTLGNGVLVNIPGLDVALPNSHSLLLDMNPTNFPPYGYDPLLVGQTYTDPITKTSISVVSKTDSSITVSVIVCRRQNPGVTVSPPLILTDVGRTETYTARVKNNDDASCGPSTFDISVSPPAEWVISPLTTRVVNLAPGQTSSAITFSATSPSVAPDGFRGTAIKATNAFDPRFSYTGSAVFLIAFGTGPDTDHDHFTDSREVHLGTDPLDKCPDNTADPAWPPDIDNSRAVNIFDILLAQQQFGKGTFSSDWSTAKRADLDGNGAVTVGDLLFEIRFFGLWCTN